MPHFGFCSGYLAPEYAIQNRVTRKSDIYSFGVLLLEIVSGRPNTNRRLPAEEQYLLTRAWNLYEKGELERLVDSFIDGEVNVEESIKFCKIGLVCTQDSSQLRPPMSTVLKMLIGEKDVKVENLTKPSMVFEFLEAIDEEKQKGKAEITNTSLFTDFRKQDDSSSGTNTSFATMTFTSIYDRSN
ncbi:unnamed protein product [Lupinus luteus]|uniref:Serine-threonine/tyrosine-protein kinase catalytic domain-containing protein n=1 Tax=Lupinus luteus TaxID=3873 RepID=A0AAV1W2Q1_LUPLU